MIVAEVILTETELYRHSKSIACKPQFISDRLFFIERRLNMESPKLENAIKVIVENCKRMNGKCEKCPLKWDCNSHWINTPDKWR